MYKFNIKWYNCMPDTWKKCLNSMARLLKLIRSDTGNKYLNSMARLLKLITSDTRKK